MAKLLRETLETVGMMMSDLIEAAAGAHKDQDKERNKQAEKTKHNARNRQPFSTVSSRLAIDLHQANDGKNQPQHIEGYPAVATTTKNHGQNSQHQARDGKSIGAMRAEPLD